MAHQNVDIELTVSATRDETPGYMSVVFGRPRGFTFDSGDWVEFTFAPGMSGGPTYSLSSAPTEPDLAITFRRGQSDIKRALAGLTPGAGLRLNSYGNNYRFTLKESQPSVLIAGGVGVAPFRSMLKEMYDLGSSNDVELVCFNRGTDFLFGDELATWERDIPGLTIRLIDTRGQKRKAREQLLRSLVADNVQYFIAGPDALVSGTRDLLLGSGVDADGIRIDNFGTF